MFTNRRNQFSLFFKRLLSTAIILTIIIALLSPVSAGAFDIIMGTAEKGTFSFFSGRLLSRIISSHSDTLNCTVSVAADDMTALTNLRSGALDLALVDSLMLYDAVNKSGYFEYLDLDYNTLRTLTPLYRVPYTLVVRRDAGIGNLAALKGKRANAGVPRSAQRLAFETIMRSKGWRETDFSLFEELPASQSQDTLAFCQGTIQAMLRIGVHPNPAIQNMNRLCQTQLVDMNDGDIHRLVNTHPAFSKIVVAADTYRATPGPVTSFGTTAMLVVSEDLDEETVYTIMEALFSKQAHLRQAHPALVPFELDDDQKQEAILPRHAGAAKFLASTP